MKKLRRRRKTGIVLATKPGMAKSKHSRFDADKVVRLATLTGEGRFEMQFGDSEGKTHVVSLPLPAAVQLGRLIYDISETAPYLVGGIQRTSSQKKK
jgi:hypothetical protein